MKNPIIIFLICLLSLSVMAQKCKNRKPRDFSITQKLELKKKRTQLILKEVISDSRCPEGLSCIWEGEAQVLVSLYKNKKWMNDTILSFSSKKKEENKKWLIKTFELPVAKIKNIQLVPYPKEGIKIDSKTYTIKVEMVK